VGDNYKHHFELTDEIDFEKGARLAKARFAVIMNETAKKEREIMNLMLDNAAEFGYTEVGVPQVASQDTLLCAGQLPKFADDVFKLDSRADIAAENNEDLKDLYLIPTAETQLANLYRGQIIDEQLPLKYCAYTRCFRSEAGSGGRDTRGLIRMHEFGKVELFQYVEPETSMDALEEMCEASEAVLRKLKLPYRKLLLCTGDMGAGARKTYDLEV
jgi:seryl-tRNA synthetase